jgi:Ribbon-helix-helix domain
MKKKISLQLSDAIVEKLKAVAEERGVNRAIIVEKALARFLSETGDCAGPSGRGGQIYDQLEGVQRELKAIKETVALHARYHLAVTSMIQGRADQPSMGHLAEIAGRVGAEIERRAAAYPADHIDRRPGVERDDPADDARMEVPFGTPVRRADRRPWATSVTEVAWGLPGAAPEGGNEDYFRGPQR